MSSFGLGPSRGHPIPRGGIGQKVPFGAVKKTSSEFLDSGISVISGATPSTVPPPPQPPPGIPYDLSESRYLHSYFSEVVKSVVKCVDLLNFSFRVRQWMEQCGDDRVRMGRPTSSPPSQRYRVHFLPEYTARNLSYDCLPIVLTNIFDLDE